MRTELAYLNHCAVLFLSRAAVNLSWYDNTYNIQHTNSKKVLHVSKLHDSIVHVGEQRQLYKTNNERHNNNTYKLIGEKRRRILLALMSL